MENLKIKVNSEAESKEVQELFFDLGYVLAWDKEKLGYEPNHIFSKNGVLTWLHDDLSFFRNHENKEITLPELRDMVVLKRNDVADATHKDDAKDWNLHYRFMNGDWYYFTLDDNWRLSRNSENWHKEHLVAIEKKEMKAKEYLKKIGNNEYMLMDGVGYSGQDDWIEVPDGADIYIRLTGKINGFYKDNFKQTYLDDDEGWVDTTAGNSYDWLRNTILWKRNPEPRQAELLVKTDSGYVLQVLDENAGGADVVCIPNGAEIAVKSSRGYMEFRKGVSFYGEECKEWCKGSWHVNDFSKHGWDIVWKRETLNDKVASAGEFKQPEDLPFVDSKIDIDVENLPDFTPEFPSEKEIKTDFPLNRGDVNYRVAKAFNEIRGTDLNEDDVNYLRELINLTVSHYGERK